MSQLAGPYIIEDRMLASGKRSVRVRFKLGKIKFDARGSTVAEATTKAAALATRHTPARLADSRKFTLLEWYEYYMETYGRHYSESTRLLHDGMMRVHVAPALGGMLLGDLTIAMVEQTVMDIARKATASATASLVLLRLILKKARKLNFVQENVALEVEKPRHKRKRKKSATPEQLLTILDAVKGDRYEDHFRLMIDTGMRVAEVVGLARCDIDLNRALVHVRQQIAPRAGALPTPLKTESSVRSVPISADVVERLRQRLAAYPELGPDDPVFPALEGGWQNSGTLGCKVRRVSKQLAIPDLHLHAHLFRHSHVTSLLQNGAPLAEVSRRVGHSQIATTLGYTHAIDGAQQKLSEAMADILKRARQVVPVVPKAPESDDWLR